MTGDQDNGFVITNTTEKVSVLVSKKWIGTAADSVTVNLYADGKKVDSQKLSKDNDWQYTFKNLEKFKDGNEIKYTVDEENLDGYTKEISGDAANGYVITNTKDTPPTPDKPDKPDKPKVNNPKNPTSNTNVQSPQTGNSTHIGLWIGLMLISAFALVLSMIFRRKHE